MTDYYSKYCANAHRGDYSNSQKVDSMYEGVREKIKNFIAYHFGFCFCFPINGM